MKIYKDKPVLDQVVAYLTTVFTAPDWRIDGRSWYASIRDAKETIHVSLHPTPRRRMNKKGVKYTVGGGIRLNSGNQVMVYGSCEQDFGILDEVSLVNKINEYITKIKDEKAKQEKRQETVRTQVLKAEAVAKKLGLPHSVQTNYPQFDMKFGDSGWFQITSWGNCQISMQGIPDDKMEIAMIKMQELYESL